MDLTSLHPATIWALHKALTAARSATRVDMPVGDNDVDELVTLHVNGTTRCGDDYDQPIVAKADPWLLLAAALSHLNGVTVESLTREALTADPKLAASLKKRAKVAISSQGTDHDRLQGQGHLPRPRCFSGHRCRSSQGRSSQEGRGVRSLNTPHQTPSPREGVFVVSGIQFDVLGGVFVTVTAPCL